MPIFWRQLGRLTASFVIAVLLLLYIVHSDEPPHEHGNLHFGKKHKFSWRDLEERFPVESFRPLPKGRPQPIPQIQADFPQESTEDRRVRERRQEAVKQTFVHAWNGYKKNAWLQDEVLPITGSSQNPFGGWGATLVDALDTLWIMGLKDEFKHAIRALDQIDFTTSQGTRISVFETNIRYLGGLLAAYDLSGRKHKAILEKAIEVGDMLYLAFDTPTRMPVHYWDWNLAKEGGNQTVPYTSCIAELGTFSLEFTRLSQLTKDPKYYDAMARVMDIFIEQQNNTMIPGLWPTSTNMKGSSTTMQNDRSFTFGALADSMYEYLPKQHLLLSGRATHYEEMYVNVIETAKQTLFFDALTPNGSDLLFSGTASVFQAGKIQHSPLATHLTCFVGGMVALGAKLFGRQQDLETARKLTNGCIWASDTMPSGIMPETFTVKRCNGGADSLVSYDNVPDCTWSDEKWYQIIHNTDMGPPVRYENMTIEEHAKEQMELKNTPMGILSVNDRQYKLRPEAIESVFIMYRITGDRSWMDAGWRMFEAVESATRTQYAHAALQDVSIKNPVQEDKMESFWLGETLKYYYLLFSEPDVVSLDQYVFNTEAHPLLREI